MRKVWELYDLHVPFNININGVLQYAKDFTTEQGKTDLVLGGDQLDLACISHWNESRLRQLEGKRLRRDYDAMNVLLDRFDKIFIGEKYWLDGNHEHWVDMFIDKFPALEGLFEIPQVLKLSQRGYKIIPLNKFMRIGKLYYKHGNITGVHHAKKTVEKTGRSVVYGHVHQRQEHQITSPIDEQGVHRGISMPCLCKLDMPYLKGEKTNWSHGFGITYFNERGYFQHNIIDIIKGQFIGLNGKEYK